MTFRTLIRRSLRFHARAHFGVVLGAAIGSAALIGALLVGDSVRESLKEKAMQRLAGTYFALNSADQFFGRDLISRFKGLWFPYENGQGVHVETASARALLVGGTAQLPSGEARANQVQIFGIIPSD